MTSPSLTPKSILSISAGNLDLRPILQVLDVKEIGAGQLPESRFRLLLSDGSLVIQGMLATQLSFHVKSGQIHKGTIVQLLEYICNTIRGRKIVMVLNIEIVGFSYDTIGDPKPAFQQEQVAVVSSNGNGSEKPQGNLGTLSGTKPGTEMVSGSEAVGEGGIGASSLTLGKSIGGAANNETLVNSNGPGLHASIPGKGSEATPYAKPVVSTSYEPAPIYSNTGPIARNQAPARIVPIAALNPYQGRWTIKARVTAKGDLRRFHNAKGDGKVFHFDLLDADGGEIRATCFNAVADRFIDEVEVGKVYLISKGSLKPAQRNFNHLKNDWEIFLENSSTVHCCPEEDNLIPKQQFNFIPITDIENTEGNAMVDVIGVVVAVSPTNTILRKNGIETQKRTVQLRDMTARSVELTMWGSFCAREGQFLQEKRDSGNFPVLAIKAGRISDFSGKSVGTISTTQLLVDPDLPEAHQLRKWFERDGKNTSYQSISQEGGSGIRTEMRKTVAQIKDEGLGRSFKPDWIAVKGIISFLKTDTFCYTACPLMVGDRPCNKKVINHGDGMWRCDRCDKSLEECDYRYLLSLQIQDHTGVTWVTAFQEAGEEILGVTAKELHHWKQDENPRFNDVVQKLLFTQHLFKLKVKEDNYNDELRVKCTVIKAERLDFPAESRALLELIGKLSRGEDNDGPGFPTAGFRERVNTVNHSAFLGYGSSSIALPGQGSSHWHGQFLATANGR